MPTQRRTLAMLAGTAMIALLFGLSILNRWAPNPPASAASNRVALAVISGPVGPDLVAGSDSQGWIAPPAGQACLARISRPAGWLDLCWEAHRDPNDADPRKDYYRLHLYGSFGGVAGTGVRWAVIRARPVGSLLDGVFDAWPTGVIEGPCAQVDAALLIGPPFTEEVCGRTSGATDVSDWSQTVTWTCESCLITDPGMRPIALLEEIGVAEGTVPSWEIDADLGG